MKPFTKIRSLLGNLKFWRKSEPCFTAQVVDAMIKAGEKASQRANYLSLRY